MLRPFIQSWRRPGASVVAGTPAERRCLLLVRVALAIMAQEWHQYGATSIGLIPAGQLCLPLGRQRVVANLDPIEPAVVVVAQGRAGAHHPAAVAEDADLQGSGAGKLACAPKRGLAAGGQCPA